MSFLQPLRMSKKLYVHLYDIFMICLNISDFITGYMKGNISCVCQKMINKSNVVTQEVYTSHHILEWFEVTEEYSTTIKRIQNIILTQIM